VAFFTVLTSKQASIAASGNQRPASPWEFWVRGRLVLRAKTGGFEVQPGGWPYPRPGAARWPSSR